MIEGLKPGVYVNLPMEYYIADPALSSSGVKQLLKSPLEYWYNSALNPERPKDDPTPAMKLGTAYHTLILEPAKFTYDIKEGVNTTKEAGKLGRGEYDMLMAMQKALCKSKKHIAILSGGVPEVSVFWQQLLPNKEAPPIMCKVRFDCFAPHWIADLKTTGSVANQNLRYAFGDFGYDISGAMYSVAAKALKKMIADGYPMPSDFDKPFIDDFCSHDDQQFVFVFQEKEPPHVARAWCLAPDVSSIGLDKFHHGLEIYDQHRATEGAWPSGYEELESVTLDMLSQSIMYN